MVFSYNQDTRKKVATLQIGETIKQYDCSSSTCTNPVCTCGTIHLSLSPMEHEDQNHLISPYEVRIDIINRKIDYQDDSEIPEESQVFASLLISKMDDADFRLLWNEYFEISNIRTAEATNDSIEAHFDYYEIEENGLMATFNDVLPYGDQLFVKINGEDYIILDQYCVLPKCSCSDAIIDICPVVEFYKAKVSRYSLTLDYRNRKWGPLEGGSKSVNTRTIKSAVEKQIPDIYEKLLNRHMRLKGIYSHCKKRHFDQKRQHHPPEAGRNDPCPCGSGKKYKKCCLIRPN